MHWLNGSVPAASAKHNPGASGCAHDWQVPVHAFSQHTPCAQCPDPQSPSVPQPTPSERLPPHSPFVQLLPGAQSAADVQLGWQLIGAQT